MSSTIINALTVALRANVVVPVAAVWVAQTVVEPAEKVVITWTI
jgi:hypothetical protein